MVYDFRLDRMLLDRLVGFVGGVHVCLAGRFRAVVLEIADYFGDVVLGLAHFFDKFFIFHD